ncbi:glutamate-5-semialdehyde dehydrogenase, partial [Thermodesulfobacteriota bacterium]
SATQKDDALGNIARTLLARKDEIINTNRLDLTKAKADNLAAPLLKRLKFDESKIQEACEGVESLRRLPDPVGQTLRAIELDDGLELYKVSCPIGVIGVVFESRPDALVQISSLCLKSGNAVLLKGGAEATNTNRILADLISNATRQAKIPDGWLGLMETRTDVQEMLGMDPFIDLIIPRGSNAFVKHIMDNTRIPVLGHADGICHVYVDKKADLDMAVRITVDSKCQYISVCNAAETLLVHRNVAQDFLPDVHTALAAHNVEIRGCPKTARYIDVIPATEKDWQTEYLDHILSIKIVDTLEQAIDHINCYGSGHTDVIVSQDKQRADIFMRLVDTADVMVNCSSRFSDGFRFGLGAEVGISTNKIHARGPVGMEGLMIYQWRLIGNGHVVSDYAGQGSKPFTHKSLQQEHK